MTTRLLIVYPSKDGRQHRRGFLPPLALPYLAGLTPEGYEIRLCNESIEAVDYDWPDVVAITATTSQATRAYLIADRFRELGTRVIMGGIHPSVMPAECLEHADAIVVGEAEEVWHQVLRDVELGRLGGTYDQADEKPQAGAPGLLQLGTYKQSAKTDLGKFSRVLPRWDLHDLDRYFRIPWYTKPIMPIQVTRGCPHSCDYCTITAIYGHKMRKRDVDGVIAELEATDAEFYFVVDDNVIGKPRLAEELFEALVDYRRHRNAKGRDFVWLAQTSVNILRWRGGRLIDLAGRAGCCSLFIGMESVSPTVLRAYGKGFNHVDEYAELIARVYRAGIVPYVSLIFGSDHDTPEVFPETIDFLERNRIMLSAWWLLTPTPGTKTHAKMLEAGRMRDNPFSQYDAGHVIFDPANFDADDLRDRYWSAYLDFFHRVAPRNNAQVRELYPELSRGVWGGAVCLQRFARRQVRARKHPFAMGAA